MDALKKREALKDEMTGNGPQSDGDIPPGARSMPVDGERMSTNFHGLYHEKQIGALCAVHALNNLVQRRQFDEVELAGVARGLDDAEAELMGGARERESQNVRSDGFFSVQVILASLQRIGLACAQQGNGASSSEPPARERGFIFNRREHWFALRRLGDTWFELNSMDAHPKAMSAAHLDLFFAAHLEKGYSIFRVRGDFPTVRLEGDGAALAAAAAACGAAERTANPGAAPAAPAFSAFGGAGRSTSGAPPLDPAVVAAAADDPELAAAIAASLSQAEADRKPASAADSKEEMRRKRLARFG